MGDGKPDFEAHGTDMQSNEAVVEDDPDVEAQKLASNVNETTVDEEVEAHGTDFQSNEAVVEDEPEVEAHGTDLQSNETVVEDE